MGQPQRSVTDGKDPVDLLSREFRHHVADTGVNATGLPFNSIAAIELRGDGRTNPMVNPGAIATTGPGGSSRQVLQ
jgi:glutaminase